MKLHIFNPSTEMALAKGAPVGYTPPRAVYDFEAHLSLLPAIYAGKGDAIFAPRLNTPRHIDALPYHSLVREKGLQVFTLNDPLPREAQPQPWGWNNALLHLLRAKGLGHLPSHEDMQRWRNLASRHTTSRIWRHFPDPLAQHAPKAFMTIKEASEFVTMLNGEAVIKSPWSSSGRGIHFTLGRSSQEIETRISQSITSQGFVMVERHWPRTIDFATEWTMAGGRAMLQGFSLFRTDAAGRYAGNYCDSQRALRTKIERHVKPGALEVAVDMLAQALEQEIAPHYEGSLGVDMMATAAGDTAGESAADRAIDIVPCIEINLRRTMGHVALDIWQLTGKPQIFIPGEELKYATS